MSQSNASMTPQFMLNIEQGSTFEHTFQSLTGGMFMAPIEFLEPGYPTVITVTGHGVNAISAMPVIISGVLGCDHINTDDVGIPLLTRLTADTLSVPLTTVGETWVEGTGEITYHAPTDFTNYSGVITIRKNWYATTPIFTGTTADGTLTLNSVDGSIAIDIPWATTASFDFNTAVYDVELTTGANYKTKVFKGPVKLHREASP